MAKRRRITGNLTPRMALDLLADVRDLRRAVEGNLVQSHQYTVRNVESALKDHVRAAVERAARK